MNLSPKLALVGLVAFSSALAAHPARAELATWDQARVTGIAQQLATACDGWWKAVLDQPFTSIGPGDPSRQRERARVLQEQSRALAEDLAHGKGHDETVDMYRSLKEVVDDTEEESERTELDEPTLDAWAKVADLLRQIAPYYDPKADDE